MISETIAVDSNGLMRRVKAGTYCGETHFPPADVEIADPTDAWDYASLRQRPRALGGAVQKLRIADLFCGVGGLTESAFSSAYALGLEPISMLAVDQDEEMLDVYAANFKPMVELIADTSVLVDYALRGSGCDATFKYAPELAHTDVSKLVGDVDLLLAGPPCQGFSNLNNHTRRNDDRNRLYCSVPSIAIALEVPLVVIENVPEIRADPSGVFETARTLFETNGYFTDSMVLSAIDLGVPQTRRRLFLVASKYERPELSLAVKALARQQRTVRWAIEDLLDRVGDTAFDKPADISEENQRRIRILFETNAYELADEHRPECHRNGHTYGAVYGRLHWDKPSQTITRGFQVPGRGRYIHPAQERTLTPHEAARLQGFSDSFRFVTRNGYPLSGKLFVKAIGNAVPPPLGSAAVLAALATVPD